VLFRSPQMLNSNIDIIFLSVRFGVIGFLLRPLSVRFRFNIPLATEEVLSSAVAIRMPTELPV
jgi:hypothetical protein